MAAVKNEELIEVKKELYLKLKEYIDREIESIKEELKAKRLKLDEMSYF